MGNLLLGKSREELFGWNRAVNNPLVSRVVSFSFSLSFSQRWALGRNSGGLSITPIVRRDFFTGLLEIEMQQETCEGGDLLIRFMFYGIYSRSFGQLYQYHLKCYNDSLNSKHDPPLNKVNKSGLNNNNAQRAHHHRFQSRLHFLLPPFLHYHI